MLIHCCILKALITIWHIFFIEFWLLLIIKCYTWKNVDVFQIFHVRTKNTKVYITGHTKCSIWPKKLFRTEYAVIEKPPEYCSINFIHIVMIVTVSFIKKKLFALYETWYLFECAQVGICFNDGCWFNLCTHGSICKLYFTIVVMVLRKKNLGRPILNTISYICQLCKHTLYIMRGIYDTWSIKTVY